MLKVDIVKNLYGKNGNMTLRVKLNVKEGEFLAIMGESGGGKTTLLRILAGLERAKGKVVMSNDIWQDENIFVPPQKRKIGFVFQNYALFTNMTVEENLLFVKKDKDMVEHLLKITELTNLRDRLPKTLSGGQKQRVGLCRALMNRPKLLLMDEPLSAVDYSMRTKLQNEIIELHKEFKTTTILVSHDPTEVSRLASRSVLLSSGRIINLIKS